MKRFIIHGREQQYHGHHGIENFEVIEFTTESDEEISHELELAGEQLSLGVMESFSNVMDDLEEIAKERFENDVGSDEDSNYDEVLEDVTMDNVEYDVYQINSEMDKYTLQDLVNMGPEEILKHAVLI